jgi:hypothetical protein
MVEKKKKKKRHLNHVVGGPPEINKKGEKSLCDPHTADNRAIYTHIHKHPSQVYIYMAPPFSLSPCRATILSL